MPWRLLTTPEGIAGVATVLCGIGAVSLATIKIILMLFSRKNGKAPSGCRDPACRDKLITTFTEVVGIKKDMEKMDKKQDCLDRKMGDMHDDVLHAVHMVSEMDEILTNGWQKKMEEQMAAMTDKIIKAVKS